ncbi:MAG: hypothetical protein K0R65_2179 [Crocinitomicaceae bacterium]|nr:hypothetical protein [Crocinitomicaceae bacterium]
MEGLTKKSLTSVLKPLVMKAIFFLLFCLCGLSYNAQVLNQVGSTIKNGATTKAADFNRTRSNKEKNDLNNNSNKSTEQNAVEDMEEESSPSPLENENPAETIDITYHFNYMLAYEASNYVPEGETTTRQMAYYFGDSCSLFTSEGSLMLNDLRTKKSLMLSEEAKTGFPAIYMQDQAEAIGNINREIYAYKKTGQVKNIMGYASEEYVLMRENSIISSIWSAIENPLLQYKLDPKFLTDQMIMGVNSMNPDPNGLLMEYNQYNDEGLIINTIRIKALEPAQKTLELGEYRITNY